MPAALSDAGRASALKAVGEWLFLTTTPWDEWNQAEKRTQRALSDAHAALGSPPEYGPAPWWEEHQRAILNHFESTLDDTALQTVMGALRYYCSPLMSDTYLKKMPSVIRETYLLLGLPEPPVEGEPEQAWWITHRHILVGRWREAKDDLEREKARVRIAKKRAAALLAAEHATEPAAETTAEPTVETVALLAAEPATEPAAETAAEPTVEAGALLAAEPATEPAAETTAEPTVEAVALLAAEPATEPAAETAAGPAAEPTVDTAALQFDVLFAQALYFGRTGTCTCALAEACSVDEGQVMMWDNPKDSNCVFYFMYFIEVVAPRARSTHSDHEQLRELTKLRSTVEETEKVGLLGTDTTGMKEYALAERKRWADTANDDMLSAHRALALEEETKAAAKQKKAARELQNLRTSSGVSNCRAATAALPPRTHPKPTPPSLLSLLLATFRYALPARPSHCHRHPPLPPAPTEQPQAAPSRRLRGRKPRHRLGVTVPGWASGAHARQGGA